MPILTTPLHEYWDDDWLAESNDCHNPPGAGGGQFCSGTGRSGLGVYPYEEGSRKIPGFLKADVLAARRAGISVFHSQQPEPVQDMQGNILDPLSKSHAQGGEHTWYDRKSGTMRAPGGRVFISTRGGEFEPTRTVWGDKHGFSQRVEKKALTPEHLKDPATEGDIIATFRHEVGHLQDKRQTRGSIGVTLGREIRAWQYAIEATPGHTLPEKMIRAGLMSHGYHEFRKQELARDPTYARINSWDREEALERILSREAKDNFISAPAQQRARAFTGRVLKSLRRYGEVLRRQAKGPRMPKAPIPWYPKQKIHAGPGGRSQL